MAPVKNVKRKDDGDGATPAGAAGAAGGGGGKRLGSVTRAPAPLGLRLGGAGAEAGAEGGAAGGAAGEEASKPKPKKSFRPVARTSRRPAPSVRRQEEEKKAAAQKAAADAAVGAGGSADAFGGGRADTGGGGGGKSYPQRIVPQPKIGLPLMQQGVRVSKYKQEGGGGGGGGGRGGGGRGGGGGGSGGGAGLSESKADVIMEDKPFRKGSAAAKPKRDKEEEKLRHPDYEFKNIIEEEEEEMQREEEERKEGLTALGSDDEDGDPGFDEQPIQLPLRPDAGAMVGLGGTLDEEAAAKMDDVRLRTAETLGLVRGSGDDIEINDEEKDDLFLLQLPRELPFNLPQNDEEGKPEPAYLKDLPAGARIGTLQVYDDGSVRMKLGEHEIPFEVTASDDVSFHEELMAFDFDKKLASKLGEGRVSARAVATPVVSELLKEAEKSADHSMDEN